MLRPVDDRADLARRSLLAMAALLPTIPAESSAANTTAPPPGLAQAVKEYDQATIANDTDALGALVADDYVLVNSDATVQDKQSYLADFKAPGFKIDPYVMAQPLLKVWGNTALTGGLLRLSWSQNGRRQIRPLRIVHIWAKHQGHWRITYTQLTRVPNSISDD